MNRLAWIAIFALAGITSLVVGDLLNPESVPVAQAVELTGTAPTDRPPPEGFFIVPPRVVDFRHADDSDDSSDRSESGEATDERSSDDDDDDGTAEDPDVDDPDGADDDGLDGSPDDSPVDSDDEVDSVDDDD